MSEHTPEPWIATPCPDKFSDDGPAFWLIDATPAPNQETAVAEICSKPGDKSEANARRIVACVNACKNIPIETLEDGGVEFALAKAGERAEEAERLLGEIADETAATWISDKIRAFLDRRPK